MSAPIALSVPRMSNRREAGSAAIEHLGLVALIGLVLIAAIAMLRSAPPDRGARELGEMIGRRIACVPRHPVPCGRNPLARAYGFPMGKLVRALAPTALAGPGGLLPVDFRHCRQPSCAAPGTRHGVTASNRRVTTFTSVDDLRLSGGQIRVSYWLYRPSLGWERVIRSAGAAEIAAAASIRLSLEQVPALVPLETLPGRDHYRWPPGEEPPWRWSVADRLPH
jgi:hypothetical protein